MRQDVRCFLAAAPALLAVTLAGCYQDASSPVATTVPVTQPSPTTAATAGDGAATAVTSVKVPEGMKAVVLAVPGMH